MPRISYFYGIGIWMYWNEGGHTLPHFHARYGGQSASLTLDGDLIAGSLPSRARRLVREWAQLHGPELAANWARAAADQPLASIEPLP
jgi:hypothetical protein